MADNKNSSPQRRGTRGRDMAFEVALGARIRAARLGAQMTQRSLGDAVGIAYQKLQKYERGQDRIAVSTLQRIAKALGLHPGQLFDDPMPKAVDAILDVKVACRSIELVQAAPDPRVLRQVLALVGELTGSDEKRDNRPTPIPTALLGPAVKDEASRRDPTERARAVVAPLLEMLRQSGTNDAGGLARLLGEALAEAEKIVRRKP